MKRDLVLLLVLIVVLITVLARDCTLAIDTMRHRHGDTPGLEVIFGTDTFVVIEGKIRQQTFAGQLKFKSWRSGPSSGQMGKKA